MMNEQPTVVYTIENYRHLKKDEVYVFTNSVDEEFIYHYRGYYFDDEMYYHEAILIMWNHKTKQMETIWPDSEMQSARHYKGEEIIAK